MSPRLPPSSKLPIEHLAACFNNVTNSYKFYWFLAILEYVRNGQGPVIALSDLLAEMVAAVWYPTNYFRLSFGKQDRLGTLALQLGMVSELPLDAPKERVKEQVLCHLKDGTELGRDIRTLGRFVPYRFLRPFFTTELRGRPDSQVDSLIYHLSAERFDSDSPCLYRFVTTPQEGIEIHPVWWTYLTQHLAIVRDFCLWNLVNYIQRRNPNVPNLPSKLFEPQQRNLNRARTFWQIAWESLEPLVCIYSRQQIPRRGFSLDHFLPWRFVAHDLLWNIVPTIRTVNSAKGDSFPDLTVYFDDFAKLQYRALQVVAAQGHDKLIEDYVILFRTATVADLRTLSWEDFKTTLYNEIAPQVQIARNMGFPTGWRYKS